MKISEKLVARLNKELGMCFNEDCKPRRMYHGSCQKAIGAWSWTIDGNEFSKYRSVGSSWNMGDLLKEKYIIPFKEYGDVSIIPTTKEEYLKYKEEND